MKGNKSREEITSSILSSPKYRAIAPDAVRRIVCEECERANPNAEKCARSRLHRIADAFMDQHSQKALKTMLAQRRLDDALRLHKSSEERLPFRNEYISFIARHCPEKGLICDAACGLDPLMLGAAGFRALGLDIQLACVNAINEWAQAEGWPVHAQAADLTGIQALPECDVTLMLKLLPVLEAQRAGEGLRLLSAAHSQKLIVSFPTKTLGGRNVGMAQNYARRFESNLPDGYTIDESVTIGTELFYALTKLG